MNEEQILKKAIKKAAKNGYYFYLPALNSAGFSREWVHPGHKYYSFIFSHNFAKAFWGERRPSGETRAGWPTEEPGWQYHLQTMVLEEEPLKYLEQFL